MLDYLWVSGSEELFSLPIRHDHQALFQFHFSTISSSSEYTQSQKLGVSQWRNPKLATTVQGSVYEKFWPLRTSPRQLPGPIVAQEVERHRDTPTVCVRVTFDIYQPFTDFVKQRAVYMIIYRNVNEDTYSLFSLQKIFMR